MSRWLVDGEWSTTLPISDSAVTRGDGCFEACRSYRGRLFALDLHLDRLERSAAQMDLLLPERSTLTEWCESVLDDTDGGTDEIVRILVTRGGSLPGHDHPSLVVVGSHPLPPFKAAVTLQPRPAPWHPAGRWSELAGAKTLSYAPNVAVSRAAKADGFDDALLVADDGTVLEGPTFTIGWVIDGRIETPGLDLHILDSISRRVVVAESAGIGVDLREVRALLAGLEHVDEVFVMSTVNEVTPVVRLGEWEYEPGPVSAALVAAFRQRVAQETGVQALGA